MVIVMPQRTAHLAAPCGTTVAVDTQK